MAAPTIPPRPSRSAQNPQTSSAATMDVPKIPPRPRRSVDRSISPHRDAFARSPLNDPKFLHTGVKKESNLHMEPPQRPPSVTLPSIGQEGSEYASLDNLHDVLPEQTKNIGIAGDLPLHAPTASLPVSTTKQRIQTVTRTDSSQAAAAGIGKLFPEDKSGHPDSSRSESSIGRSRPQSLYREGEEHGIPEIGVQVPMYPNAGDVQAPTPSPFQAAPVTGVGYFNKGDQPAQRHHSRTKSGREIFHGPPGSYGLHGHGIIPNDQFEQQWYQKHPDELKREKQGEYGPQIKENRKDYHWVQEDLNKIVKDTRIKGIGMGTSPAAVGTPDEQIGYIAQEMASRMTSPRPASNRPPSLYKEKSIESPLHTVKFPPGVQDGSSAGPVDDTDDDVIHIDPPSHRSSKVHGGYYEGSKAPKEDLGPKGGNTEEEGGWVVETGYGVPILASDEVAKNPEAGYLQPAVSPELERRGSGEYTVNEDGVPEYITSHQSRSKSRSSSRNNARQTMGVPLHRVISPENERASSALGDVKEYEPLFPEDEEPEKPKKTPVDKLKRPELARHHFPSEDIWEDTPSSLQLETTVETPDVPEEPSSPPDVGPAKVFETPEAEKAREEVKEEDKTNFLPDHTQRFAKSRFNKDVLSDIPARPGMKQRFPSQDIWEDAADHHHLEATVSSPQIPEADDYAESPTVEKPQSQIPSIPPRPSKPKETASDEKKAPVLPDRPKPQVPARPARPITKSSEPDSTTADAKAASPPKPKPAVPARPAGSKIAALQAGFMKDLNNKLGLGPQAPKPKEQEPEKEEAEVDAKPLQDARKGRAKGPARRKPVASPAPAPADAASAAPSLSFAPVTAVWAITDADLEVPSATIAKKLTAAIAKKSEVGKDEVVQEPEVSKVDEKKVDVETADPEAKTGADDKDESTDQKADGATEEAAGTSLLDTAKGLVSKAVNVASPILSSSPEETEKKEEKAAEDA